MDARSRMLAVLNYQPYDLLPLVHFGYWVELLDKWAQEGHISLDEARNWQNGNLVDVAINQRLGFDSTWAMMPNTNLYLDPPLEKVVLEQREDGSQVVINQDGVTTIEKPGLVSIPMELDHMLKGRKEWEEIFKPRLQWNLDRLKNATVLMNRAEMKFDPTGLEALKSEREAYYGIWCGSMLGLIRNWIGLMELCRMMVRKDPLLDEMIETLGELIYQGVQACLQSGAIFDFGHFWEDLAFRSGPLINPKWFAEKIGPHYRRITGLLHENGINLVSVDSDGMIDALIPTWLENGVNIMFPIEVGAWNGSIKPWREKYGRELRGIGGMRKQALEEDFAAVDAEIERLKPLVELGGYIPCPDHLLPIDTKWENVQYYCERMRKIFS